MSGAAVNDLLEYALAMVCALAGVKLWHAGLHRKYRALWSFLLIVSLNSCTILVVFRDFGGEAYKLIWEIFQPLTWFFSVWVVLELYSLILERHKGLATVGRWIQYAGFAVSTVVSLLVMMPQVQTHSARVSPLIGYYYAIERGVDCGMLVFLLCILVWLTRYPLPLSRNTVVHAIIYSLLFLTNSLGLFAQAFFGATLSRPMTTSLSGVLVLCVLAWLIFLTPKGEESRVTVAHYSPADEDRVLSRLDALNSTLLKISKN